MDAKAREELVELVAYNIFASGFAQNMANARGVARAALAVIEPVLRADIALGLDCGCDCRDAVLAAKTRTEQQYACGRDPCSALEAREIRGSGNGG